MEWIMTTTCPAPENIRTGAALKGVLREIGYVLWLSRRLAAQTLPA